MIPDDVRGLMTGNDCLMVAPGPSSKEIDPERYKDYWTISCNRAVSYSDPDFAICLEPMRDKVWPIIKATAPFIVFTHLCDNPGSKKPHQRCIHISSKDVLRWIAPERANKEDHLRVSQSAFYGCAVACLLGFETIGLIGVDHTPDRFREWEIERFNTTWLRLQNVMTDKGSRMVNLSRQSRLKSITPGEWDDICTK